MTPNESYVPSTDFDHDKTDRIQLTYWFMDERSSANVESGYGFALTASRQCHRWLGFVRWGHSDGGAGVAAENAFSAGFEYAVRDDQAFALAGGWAEPSEKTHGIGLREEYVLEASYRMQISPSFSIMPDIQVLFDPANNPDESVAWVFGLRSKISF